MQTETMSTDNLTIEELEQLLNKKREKERKELERKRKAYEAEREQCIQTLFENALNCSIQLQAFKEACVIALQEQGDRLREYGLMRKNSLGGFSIMSEDGEKRIKYSFRSLGTWDERAVKAEELLKDFLADTIKKKDQTAYEIIMSLIAKNKKGQLEYSRVQTLYQFEDKYTDSRWLEAIRLLKESFITTDSRFDIYFDHKDSQGAWQSVDLNFAGMSVEFKEEAKS